jgi:hypothetical protein
VSRVGACARRRATVGGAAPTVNRVTVSGIKRQGVDVWFQVEDDGTADKYKFDIVFGGSSLLGVTIRDGASSGTGNFPYVTPNNAIDFDVPGPLALADYTIQAYAGKTVTGVTTWSPAKVADENFGRTTGTYFMPSTIATPTITRSTGSGTTPMSFTVDGVTLLDNYYIRVRWTNASGVQIDETYVPLSQTALTTPFHVDMTGATDPTPTVIFGAIGATDFYYVSIVSGDWDTQGGAVQVSGISSAEVAISPTDATPPMLFSSTYAPTGTTISNSGRSIHGAGGPSGSGTCRLSRGVAGGKGYVEFNVTSGTVFIGLCDGSAPIGDGINWDASSEPHAAILQSAYGQIECAGSYSGIGLTFTTGDTIDLAWDETAKRMWFRKNNGSWYGASTTAGNPASGTGGYDYSAHLSGQVYPGLLVGPNGDVTIATQQSGYTRTPPSGFGT